MKTKKTNTNAEEIGKRKRQTRCSVNSTRVTGIIRIFIKKEKKRASVIWWLHHTIKKTKIKRRKEFHAKKWSS